MKHNDIAALQKWLGYTFRNPALLTEALMHRSFATEHRIAYDNQRLEFLGDAVLQIAISKYVFDKFSKDQEGDLTKIRAVMANQDTLAAAARSCDIGDALMLGHGEIALGGADRDSTLCDAFESVIAAIYLDSDLETASELALKMIESVMPHPESETAGQNPKGMLQEICQRDYGKCPVYELVESSGPDHNPSFTVEAQICGQPLGRGTAGKRKTAENEAARAALEQLKNKGVK